MCSFRSKFLLILALCYLVNGVVGDPRAFHLRRQDKASLTITETPTTTSRSPTQTRISAGTNDKDGVTTKQTVEIQSKSSTLATSSSSRTPIPSSTLPVVLPSNINGPAPTAVLNSDSLYNGIQTQSSASFYC